MRIGIDLDGVIFDTERYFRVISDLKDVDTFGLDNVIDNRIINFQDRYKWDKDFSLKFYSENVFKAEREAGFLHGAVEVIKRLKNMGFDLYIVSARGIFSEKQIDISMELLKENDIDIFTKYIFKAEDKRNAIIENKIDYMIDDNIDVCNSLKDLCNVIYLKASNSFDADDKRITTLYNWAEIYRYFKNIKDNML